MAIQLFVDTNILLSFYHYTKDELDEIRKLTILIKQKEIKLFITQQVVDEYRRNREVKLNDSMKQINEKFKFGDFPAFCKEFSGFNELQSTIKKAQVIYKDLLDYCRSKILHNELHADLVISELFQSAEILDVSQEIYDNAKRRVVLGNPPGKNGSYGDAINWETILNNSDILEDLHIVANDKDYYSLLDEKNINPFLKLEYNENMLGEVRCYRSLSTFFKQNFPNISLVAEQEKEEIIFNLINSPNFATTRKELRRLSNYKSYTVRQIEDLLFACFNNTQINWILSDDDIKDQIFEIFNTYRESLTLEVRDEFLFNWYNHFPDDLIVINEDEQLPF